MRKEHIIGFHRKRNLLPVDILNSVLTPAAQDDGRRLAIYFLILPGEEVVAGG
jgi:hypothetical protein